MNKKERKRSEPLSRSPHRKRTEVEMIKIAKEINDGLIGILPASYKYGLCRNTLKHWLARLYLRKLEGEPSTKITLQMTEEH